MPDQPSSTPTLSLRLARLSLILMLGFLVLVVVGFFTRQTLLMVIAFISGLAALVIKICFLRCPYCGQSSATPMWSNKVQRYCPYCRRRFEFK